MRKIISGKAYDTTTGKKIAEKDNGYYCNDFNYACETLYKTPKGGWFLYGEGGASSAYASSVGRDSGYGHSIIPKTQEEAAEWLSKNNFTDEYEACFGAADDAEDSASYQFKIRNIPEKTYAAIKAAADEKRVAMNDIFLSALVEYLKK